MKHTNASLAVFLINDFVRGVLVEYEPGAAAAGKTYFFKTFDKTIKKDDIVIIPTDTRQGFTCAKVSEVDVEPDFNSNIQYKWIAGKLNKAEYEATLEQEADAARVISQAEKKKARMELREAMSIDEDTVKALQIAKAPPVTVIDALSAPQPAASA